MKKVFCVILASLLLVASLAACGNGGSSSGDTQTFILRSGTPTVMPNPQSFMLEEVQTRVEAATDRITVEVYQAGSLGTNAQMIQGLQDGSIQAAVFPVNWYEASIPEFGVLGLPGLFDSGNHAYEIIIENGSKVGALLQQYAGQKGFTIASWMLASDVKLLSTKPINKFDDLKGLRVWCLPDTNVIATLNALGMTPVNFDVGDLAVGLQQGTVDAAYTTLPLFMTQRLFESAPYFLDLSGVNYNIAAYMMSKSWLDSMPGDLRELLLNEIGNAGYEAHRPSNIAFLDRAMNTCVEGGMEVITPDDEFMRQVRAATATVIEEFLKSTPQAQELYDAVMAAK